MNLIFISIFQEIINIKFPILFDIFQILFQSVLIIAILFLFPLNDIFKIPFFRFITLSI